MQQYDVKNAFLYGELEEEVFKDPPLGFSHSLLPNQVYKLKKILYGLKQSPKAWFERFTQAMISMGYQQSQEDHTLFIKHFISGRVTILIVYIDDIIITGDDLKERDIIRKRLSAKFKIKELGKLKYFLGIEVTHLEKKNFYPSTEVYYGPSKGDKNGRL